MPCPDSLPHFGLNITPARRAGVNKRDRETKTLLGYVHYLVLKYVIRAYLPRKYVITCIKTSADTEPAEGKPPMTRTISSISSPMLLTPSSSKPHVCGTILGTYAAVLDMDPGENQASALPRNRSMKACANCVRLKCRCIPRAGVGGTGCER